MGDQKKYSGGCHCGRVRYEVTLDLEKPVVSCNCSICGRAGTLLAFVPATQFSLQSGEDALTDYKFNKMHISHLFCRVCGIKSFARGTAKDGTPTVAVNVRCLDGVNLDSLKITAFDGKNM